VARGQAVRRPQHYLVFSPVDDRLCPRDFCDVKRFLKTPYAIISPENVSEKQLKCAVERSSPIFRGKGFF